MNIKIWAEGGKTLLRVNRANYEYMEKVHDAACSTPVELRPGHRIYCARSAWMVDEIEMSQSTRGAETYFNILAHDPESDPT